MSDHNGKWNEPLSQVILVAYSRHTLIRDEDSSAIIHLSQKNLPTNIILSHSRLTIQLICDVRWYIKEEVVRGRKITLSRKHNILNSVLMESASILFPDPGCLHVPLFIEDDTPGLLTALKRQIQFGFGGWWLGQRLTMQNEAFVSQVEQQVEAKDGPLLVACGEGLR